MKAGDLVKYSDFSKEAPKHVALVLRVYTHIEEYKECQPYARKLADVLWDDGTMLTHDTYDFEVVSESR